MQQVWKCDYCSDTNKNPEKIKAHEADCTFNPAKKSCYTCRHREDDGSHTFGFYNSCQIGLETYEGEEGNCEGWKIEIKDISKKVKNF